MTKPTRRERDARWLLAEAARRLPHAPHPGATARGCFRCQIVRFLRSRRPLPDDESPFAGRAGEGGR
jgi:hypothetical protein